MSSPSDARDEAVPKLPLWDTICASYAAYFHNFLDVLRICWLWLVVVGPLMAIANWMQWLWMAPMFAGLRQGAGPQRPIPVVTVPIELRVMIYGVGLIFTAAGVSIAVAWHRRLILGEHPRLSGGNIASGSFWRYAGMGIAIFLTAFVPMILGMSILFVFTSFFTRGGPVTVIVVLIVILFYLAGIAAVLRLCLLLPARAVGDLSVTFKQAWRRTHGNTWRMFWGIMACTLPPALIVQILSLVLFGFPGPGMLTSSSFPSFLVAISAIFSVYYLLILPIWIGFWSFSYLHFFGHRPNYGVG
jgi:hypothetical protein